MTTVGSDTMIHVRTLAEIERIRQCGTINANIHAKVQDLLQPGISTLELNDRAAELIHLYGAKSSIRDTHGFPGDICISVNEEVGHGVPGRYIIRDGDVVKIDVSVEFEGYHTDCAVTHIVGNGSHEAQRLVDITSQALWSGISSAKPNRRCSDISFAVFQVIQGNDYSVIRHAFGHGIGKDLHESPPIANFGPPNRGPRLRPGMVIAIEPVVSAGSRYTLRHPNGWTDTTVDGSLGAHFEHTVLITDGEPEVLTQTADSEKYAVRCELSSGEIIYKEMIDADKPALLRLVAQEMDPILMQAWGRKASPQEIFVPDAQTIVLRHESGDIAGFFVCCEIGDALHLNTLVIGRNFQGMGIGKQVMKRIEDMASKRNLKRTRLCVQTNNHRAMQFYKKLGYAICGKPFPNTLLMTKPLLEN
jgi:methionine aminopeptidase type I